MLARSPIPSGLFSSLTFRLLAVLTIALTPIGAIAVYQTFALSEELERSSQTSLLAAARRDADRERHAFQRTFGAAYALAETSRSILGDTGACQRLMTRFISRGEVNSLAAVVTREGRVLCSSSRSADAVLAAPEVMEAIRDERTFAVRPVAEGGAAGDTVVLGYPVRVGDEIRHYVVIGIPAERLEALLAAPRTADPTAIALVNHQGELIAGEPAVLLDAGSEDAGPSVLRRQEETELWRIGSGSDARFMTRVLLYGNTVMLLSRWDTAAMSFASAAGVPAWTFPILMFGATLLVTYFAINRLVIRHVNALGKRMRIFSRNRRVGEAPDDVAQPIEFAEMNDNFRVMAEAILRDEAELENALHEKNLLLREVHHRVKNNLQLIASIMNMQIRKSRSSETSEIVRRLQDRVLGLATVHRQVYKAHSLDEVPVDELIGEIVDQAERLAAPGSVDVRRAFSPAVLTQNQAVPFALLAAEAVSNAVRHCAADTDRDCWVEVRLEQNEGTTRLEVLNSAADPEAEDPRPLSSNGLGDLLIRAFAQQLDADIARGSEAGVYSLRVELDHSAREEPDETKLAGVSAA